jgi:hypothetical protein
MTNDAVVLTSRLANYWASQPYGLPKSKTKKWGVTEFTMIDKINGPSEQLHITFGRSCMKSTTQAHA